MITAIHQSKEIWKPIKGIDHAYISSFGRCKSTIRSKPTILTQQKYKRREHNEERVRVMFDRRNTQGKAFYIFVANKVVEIFELGDGSISFKDGNPCNCSIYNIETTVYTPKIRVPKVIPLSTPKCIKVKKVDVCKPKNDKVVDKVVKKRKYTKVTNGKRFLKLEERRREVVGKLFRSNNCGYAEVIQYTNNRKVLVKFIKTDVEKVVKYELLCKGEFTDVINSATYINKTITKEDIEYEVWKDIEGCDTYKVSNLGRVKRKEKLLKPHKVMVACQPRLQYNIKYTNGKHSSIRGYNLVIKAFLGEGYLNIGKIILKDGDYLNTRLSNISIKGLDTSVEITRARYSEYTTKAGKAVYQYFIGNTKPFEVLLQEYRKQWVNKFKYQFRVSFDDAEDFITDSYIRFISMIPYGIVKYDSSRVFGIIYCHAKWLFYRHVRRLEVSESDIGVKNEEGELMTDSLSLLSYSNNVYEEESSYEEDYDEDDEDWDLKEVMRNN